MAEGGRASGRLLASVFADTLRLDDDGRIEFRPGAGWLGWRPRPAWLARLAS